MIRLLALLALSAALTLAACGDDSGGGGDGQAPAGAETAASSAKASCARVAQPEARDDNGADRPTGGLDPSKDYDVTFATSCGEFTVRLDVKGAPHTAASFAKLAEDGFYDDTTFHRIVPGFVIQGGDPTGTGTGGPGYQTIDRPARDTAYTKGVVAMAKTATEPPGTGGSQFYVVTAPDAGLPPEYAVVGEVTAGMDTVMRIEKLGGPDERPQRPVVIEGARVKKS